VAERNPLAAGGQRDVAGGLADDPVLVVHLGGGAGGGDVDLTVLDDGRGREVGHRRKARGGGALGGAAGLGVLAGGGGSRGRRRRWQLQLDDGDDARLGRSR